MKLATLDLHLVTLSLVFVNHGDLSNFVVLRIPVFMVAVHNKHGIDYAIAELGI